MQKVADRALEGKSDGQRKVDQIGSYAHSAKLENKGFGHDRPSSLTSSESARNSCGALKCFAPVAHQCAGAEGHEPTASRGVQDRDGGAGRGAAIAPVGDAVRSASARARNRNPLACPPGGRARQSSDRPSPSAAAGGLPGMRVVDSQSFRGWALPSVRRLARGAS